MAMNGRVTMVKLLRCWRLGVRVASFPVLCGVLLALLPRPVAAAEKLTTDSASQTSAVQALGMLQQVVSHVGDCVRRKDLSSVHVEDVLLGSAMAAVMEVAKSLSPEVQSKFRADLEEFGRLLGELHYVSDLRKQPLAEQHLLLVLQSLGRIKSYFPEATLQAASVMAEQYVCPLHPETTGRRTEFCPKCGRELEQQVRLIAGRTNGPYCSLQTVQAAIRTDGPLVVGRKAKAFLTLTHLDRKPVFSTDLIEMHTRKVHLLLIDSGLTDYHHEHPVPTLNPGEFFGDISLFDHGPRSADVVANTNAVLLKVSATNFQRLSQEVPELATPFLTAVCKTLTARIRADNKRLRDSINVARATR